MPARLQPLDKPDVAPLSISPRLRGQIVYFAAPADAPGRPTLGDDEYFLPSEDVVRILDDGFLELVSPLDTDKMTEVELTEEQEIMLEWLRMNKIQHVRVME